MSDERNTPHGSRGEACDKICGFQRQRELTTKGLVILRILWILREIKKTTTKTKTITKNYPPPPELRSSSPCLRGTVAGAMRTTKR